MIKWTKTNIFLYLSKIKTGNPTTSLFSEGTAKGATIRQTITGMDCTYNISCKSSDDVNVTRCQQFDPAGSGEKLWNDLKENAKLTEKSTDENLKCEFKLVLFSLSPTYDKRHSSRLLFIW